MTAKLGEQLHDELQELVMLGRDAGFDKAVRWVQRAIKATRKEQRRPGKRLVRARIPGTQQEIYVEQKRLKAAEK